MAAGRSVLIFEPDDKLKRALAARILAWGRLVQGRGDPGSLRAETAALRPLNGRRRSPVKSSPHARAARAS